MDTLRAIREEMGSESFEAEVRALMSNRVLGAILDELERDAIEMMANAAPQDDETRSVYSAEVRAVRSVKTKMESHSISRVTRGRV